MSVGRGQHGRLNSGWILVSGVLLLCLLGTGLTWWNYSRQVFSSADATLVSRNGKAECLVVLPVQEATAILPGHGAIITVGQDKHPLKGRVVSLSPDPKGTEVKIRLVEFPAGLPLSSRCSVTIDTTIPPQ